MKKNIWIINHYATNTFSDRGGRHYFFAKNLKKLGYNPTIFCANTLHNSDDIYETGNDIFTEKEVDEIPYVFVKTSPYKGNGISRVKNMVNFYRNLIKTSPRYIKNNCKPDIILASSVHPLTMVAGIKIAKKLNIPCICEIRDLWPEAIFAFDKAKKNSFLGKLLIKGEHWIYKNADALIFTKEGDTDYIKEKKWDVNQGGDIDLSKAYYINNGVDLEAFDENVKKNKLEDEELENDKFKVTYVGAIRPVNNLDKILDSAKLLKDYEDIQFLIYGDGNEKERLKNRVNNEHIDNVKFKGFVNKSYVPYILSKSSINILNYSQSKYNWSRGNSSNKLFEYMASGKPIISTIKMGYSIIDKYKCGIELEDELPEILANEIIKIKKMDFEKYNNLGKNARLGSNEFDFSILSKKLVKVIEDTERGKIC